MAAMSEGYAGALMGYGAMDLRAIAARMVKRTAGDQGSVLDAAGMSAETGEDADMASTHTDLEEDDIENVDTRPDPVP